MIHFWCTGAGISLQLLICFLFPFTIGEDLNVMCLPSCTSVTRCPWLLTGEAELPLFQISSDVIIQMALDPSSLSSVGLSRPSLFAGTLVYWAWEPSSSAKRLANLWFSLLRLAV